jgi:hypothetical protein
MDVLKTLSDICWECERRAEIHNECCVAAGITVLVQSALHPKLGVGGVERRVTSVVRFLVDAANHTYIERRGHRAIGRTPSPKHVRDRYIKRRLSKKPDCRHEK